MRFAVQELALRGSRIALIQLGEGRLRDISLHFGPHSAFILLDGDGSDGGAAGLDLAVAELRHRGKEATAGRLAAARGSYMTGHAAGVRDLAVQLARALRLDDLATRQIAHAAILHDIGKILVPAKILSKNGPLTAVERAIVQRHAGRGADVLRAAGFPDSIVRAVAAHHERLDGRGYPDRLSAGDIPLASRIIAVADAYDVMVNPRAYGCSRSGEESIAELLRCAERQFDPRCVEALSAAEVPRPRVSRLFEDRVFTLRDRLRPPAQPPREAPRLRVGARWVTVSAA